ncbi:spermidine synthase [Mesonia aestuariivivens]|uniref:Fused MFS/spermidine synthase n=1 Tax=Mesonia aestuariivivens TaxID=2796128 RepID=A0ABS6W4L1_9FLAO|nr:fused MFS/spermidine synthase [Mesonia aestuariivivens]MBW2962068.1 fused MFS/spermidine synthase [Mesonia aestuariivivens]
MKRTLSYLWPLTKKVSSEFSGELEVTWLNGKKILDTKNANYSYGTLHQILDVALQKTNANRGGHTLILGLGGGSILQLLRKKYNFYGKITAVELDPKIIEIAKKEFNIQQYEPLEVIGEDAEKFVKQNDKKFDTVIVDLFIDIKVPEQFYEIEFWQNVSILLQPKATIIFNAGIGENQQAKINQLQQQIAQSISFEKIEHVKGTNTLLLGNKI